MSGKTKKSFFVKKLQWGGALVLTAVAVLMFSTCEIGLGKSVDTQVPELSITQPTSETAPIRGSFKIKGTCKDDGIIKSIVVSFQGIDSGKNDTIKKEVEATIIGDPKSGSMEWEYEINPADEKDVITDGSYQLIVTATDTFDHATVDKLTFTIDNTPPILVLQRPSSNWLTDDGEIDVYGQDFSLTGQSADNSDVGKIEVNIYTDPECTQKWDTITLSKVPPTVDNTVMHWADDGNSKYNELYGNNKYDGDKKYYCVLIAYDDARPCPDEGDEAGKGNSANYYYLYNDIYEEVLSQFKLTQVYSILNGTYTSSDRAAIDNAAKVKQVLSETGGKRTQRGSFKLNPLNSPTFSLSGYDPLKKVDGKYDIYNNEEKQILNKSLVTIKISSGLDKTPLRNETFGISVRHTDTDGNIIESEPPIVLVPAAANLFGSVTLPPEEQALRDAAKITNVGSYDRTVAFTLSSDTPGLNIGSCYIFDVVAYDTSGRIVENVNTKYGFQLASNKIPPDLNIVSPVGITSVGPNSKVVIVGNTYHDMAVPQLEVKVGTTSITTVNETTAQAKDPGNPEADYYIVDPTAKGSKPGETYGDFQITIDISAICSAWPEGEQTVYITSTVVDPADPTNPNLVSSTQKERTLNYDKTAPTISSVKITPTPLDYEISTNNTKENVVNGKITISGKLLDDNGIEEYYLSTDSANKKSGGKAKSVSYSFDVDTTKLTDNKDLELTIHTKDIFGNEDDRIVYVDADATAGKYYIIQESDRPVITNSNVTFGFISETDVMAANTPNNIFDKSTKITLSITDDDGVDSVEVFYRKAGTSDSFEKLPKTNTSLTNPEFSISDLADGKYEIYAEVKDIKYNSSTPVAQNYNITTQSKYTTYIGVTTGSPAFTGVTIDDGSYNANTDYWYPAGESIVIKGSLIGDNDSTVKKGSTPITVTSKAWTDTITIPTTATEGATVVYTVTDIYGRTANQEIKYKVDTIKPTAEITSPSRIERSAISDSYSFEGKSADTNGSGIANVFYKVQKRVTPATAPTANKTGEGWNPILIGSTGGSWSLPISVKEYVNGSSNTTSEFEEGEYTLYVYSLDKAKNFSDVVSVDFDVNMAAPTIILKAQKTTGGTAIADNSAIKEAFHFKYEAYDSYTPTPPTVTYKVFKDGTELTTSTTPAISVNDGVISIVGLATGGTYDGTYKVEVQATDAFKKPSDTKPSVTIVYDTKGPDVTISYPGTDDWFNSSATANGKVDDNVTGVDKIYYKLTTNTTESNADWTNWNEITTYSGGKDWSVKPNASTEGKGSYLHVAAEDKNENKSVVVSRNIKIDTKAPVIGTPVLKVKGESRTKINSADVDDRASNPITITVDVTDPISSSDSTTNSGVASIELWEGNTKYDGVSYTEADNKYTLTLSDTTNELSDGTHNFYIKAYDNAGNESKSANLSVIIDTANPTAEISSISPTVTVGGKDYVNGKIIISGNVTDTTKLGTSISYEIWTGGSKVKDGTATLQGSGSTSKKWTPIEINTTEINDGSNPSLAESECKIKITVKDDVGNEGYTEETFTIKQSTDAPDIDSPNFEENYAISSIKTDTNNLFGKTANNKLTGTITDDDKISSVTVKYAKYDDWNSQTNKANATWKTPLSVTNINKSSYTLDCALTKASSANHFNEDGEYHVEIIIVDEFNETSFGTKTISTNVVVSSGAPTITTLAVNPIAGKKDSELDVTGTLSAPAKVQPTLIQVDENGVEVTGAPTITITADASDKTKYTFAQKVTVTNNTTDKATEYVYYKVSNKYGEETTSSTTYTADGAAPTVAITSISPYVDLAADNVLGYTAGQYLNGEITVAGTANDNYALDKIVYNVYQGSDNTGTKKDALSGEITETTKLNSWSFKVDTTKITDGQPIFIEVIAYDKAGWTTSVNSTSYNGDKVYTVDQETDRPRVTPTNFDMGKASADVKENANLFGRTSNNKLNATIEDDDGIKQIVVTYRLNDDAANQLITKTINVSGTQTTYPLTLTLDNGNATNPRPLDEGRYKINIKVIDKNYKDDTTTPHSFTVDVNNTSWFGISNGAPKVTITTANGVYYKPGATVEAKFDVDSTGLTVSGTAGTGITVSTPVADGEKSYKSNITVPDVSSGNTVEVTYTAKNTFEETGEAKFSFKVDKTPSVSATNFEVSGTTYKEKINNEDYVSEKWFNNPSVKIDGFFSDEHSGVNTILVKSAASAPSDFTGAAEIAATRIGSSNYYKFSASVDITKTNKNVYLKAIDNAGNESTIKEYKFRLDEDAPKLSLATVDGDSNVSQKLVNKKSAVEFVVSVDDKDSSNNDGSGIKEVKCITYDVTPTEITTGQYQFEIPSTSLKNGGVVVEVTDTAGNKTRDTLFTISIDSVAPTVTLNAPADADTSKAGIQVNKTITLSGTASDGSTLNKAPKFYYKKGTTPGTVTEDNFASAGLTLISTATPETTNGYSWTSKAIDTAATITSGGTTTRRYPDGTYFFVAEIEDIAGNKGYSAPLEIEISQDTDRPIVKVTNLTKSDDGKYSLKYGTNASVSGSVNDDDATSTKIVEKVIATSSQITSATATGISSSTVASGTTSISKNFVTYNTEYEAGSSDPKYKVTTETITVKENDIVTTYERKVDAATGNYSATGTLTAYDVTVFTPASGEWTYYPYNKDDASKDVYFFVTDNNNASFYTGNSDTLSQTKFQYKTSDSVNDDTKISYTSDGTSPSVDSAKIYGGEENTGTPAESDFNAISTTEIVGGTLKRYIKFQIKASDNNGIASMTLEANGKSNGNLAKYTTGTTGSGYTNNGSFAATTDSRQATWTTGFIDLGGTGGKTSEAIEVTVNVYDQTGLKGNGSYTFTIDNTEPVISNISKSPDYDEVTGTFTLSGAATDEGSSITNIEYMIPTSAQYAKTEEALKSETTWLDTLAPGKTKTSWAFTFADKKDENYGKSGYCPPLTQFDVSKLSGDTNTYHTAYDAENGVYTLPIFLRATDSVGNQKVYKGFSFEHNPDGDKPRTTFGYPAKEYYDSGANFVTLSGTIRMNGTVEIPGRIGSVAGMYIQIGDSSGNFGEAEKTKAGKGSGNYGYEIVTADEAGIGKTPEDSGLAAGERTNWWGIRAKDNSWTSVLNSLGELNAESGTNNISVRACGVNTNGKCGKWSETIYIHIDKDVPTAKNVTFRQYDENATITEDDPIIQKAYERGSFIRGEWYLYMDLEDTNGIKEIKVTQTINEVITPINNVTIAPGNAVGSYENKKLWIPISGYADGEVTFTVTASDNSSPTSEVEQKYIFSIDNTAPVIDRLSTTTSGLYAEAFDGTTNVYDSNGTFGVANEITEGLSGFERSVFFFMRGNAFIDPFDLYPDTESDATKRGTPKKTKITGLIEIPVKQKVGNTEETYKMYGKAIRGTASGNTFTGSGTSVSTNTNIRAGGLVQIGGLFYRIRSIAGEVVTFEPEMVGSATTANFVYGQVVDNTVQETGTANGYEFSFSAGGSDDGDGMPEKVQTTTAGVNWSADIHSSNMADGKAKLVVLTFDKAGNVAYKEVDTYISNNAPRIAKVYLGTDLNGNGKFSQSEFVEYNFYSYSTQTAKGFTSYELETGGAAFGDGKHFIVKDKLAVVPEIVGGNLKSTEKLMMVYDPAASSTDSVKKATGNFYNPDTTTSVTLTTTMAKADAERSSAYKDEESKFPVFTIDKLKITSGDGEDKGMSFSFWDCTEDTTQGTDSQAAVLYVNDFEVRISDSVPPKSVVNRFFWKGKGKDDKGNPKNSIYDGNTSNGHIELEGDLTDDLQKSPFTKDAPKVSGKVTFRGTVYDNKCLDSIWVHFDKFTFAKYLTTTTSVGNAGTYTKNGETYYLVAKYDKENESWDSAAATMTADSWELKVDATQEGDDESYFGQDGHRLYWELSFDTAAITGVASADINLKVLAVDSSGNVTSLATGDKKDAGAHSVKNVPTYQMDVVPYVTKVYTGLSSLKPNNWSVHGRTAKGHYSVASTETIYLYGFNLTGSTAKVGSATAVNLTAATNAKDSNAACYSVAISTFGSGSLEVAKDAIKALNNINDNNAYGTVYEDDPEVPNVGDKDIYDNFYNRQPNGDNNNNLTDDLYLDVWQITPQAARPRNGSLLEPVMNINPNNGMVGFAFVNGSDSFSMGTDDNSYTWKQYNYADYRYVSFAYDETGRAWATAAGLDTEPSHPMGGRFTLFSSNWDKGDHGAKEANYYGTGGLRIDSMGIPAGVSAQGETVTTGYPDTYRFRSPSLTTAVHGTGNNRKTAVYLAYVDVIQGQIRFRQGEQNYNGGKSSFGDFQDNIGIWSDSTTNTNTNNGYVGWNAGAYPGERLVYEVNTNNFSLIAGKDYQNSNKDTGQIAGEYVAIDVVPGNSVANDVVVAVWFDGTDCYYSYIKNPASGKDLGDGSSATPASGSWRTPIKIFSNAGEHCVIAVDGLGGIHIAGYDISNADLKYAYLSAYNAAYSETTDAVTVDGYDIVGTRISIDTHVKQMTVNGSSVKRGVPVISYYSASTQKPRYATFADVVSGADYNYKAAGVDSLNQYTGAWEVRTIPASGRLQDDRINIGVWKHTSASGTTQWRGLLKNSTTGSSNLGEATGKCYGNGTSNPILGYATRSGAKFYIETAQMK